MFVRDQIHSGAGNSFAIGTVRMLLVEDIRLEKQRG